MRLADLSNRELRYRLEKTGLYIHTGPFVTRIQSKLEHVAEGLDLLYADYPLAEQIDFADFHVSLDTPPFRRSIRPQVTFYFDCATPFKPLPLAQAFPMFEWGLNWCISNHAHGYLIIHAAVVEKDGRAAIMPAPPGSGKSTLCAALIHRGWRLLSDELALIRLSDAKLIPCPRPVSLKNASIDIIKHYEPSAAFSRTVSDTIKGTVAHMQAPKESIERGHEVAHAAWVIFPRYDAHATARLENIGRARAFMRVADNSFNYSLLGKCGFDALTKFIDECTCYDFTYSALNDAIDIFERLRP